MSVPSVDFPADSSNVLGLLQAIAGESGAIEISDDAARLSARIIAGLFSDASLCSIAR